MPNDVGAKHNLKLDQPPESDLTSLQTLVSCVVASAIWLAGMLKRGCPQSQPEWRLGLTASIWQGTNVPQSSAGPELLVAHELAA